MSLAISSFPVCRVPSGCSLLCIPLVEQIGIRNLISRVLVRYCTLWSCITWSWFTDLAFQYRLPWGPPCHQDSLVSLYFLYSSIFSNALSLIWWLFRNHYRARWGSGFLLSEIPWRPSSPWVFHLEMDFRPWVRPYVLLSTVSLTVGSPGCVSHGLHVHDADPPG